jgi:syntaxin 7
MSFQDVEVGMGLTWMKQKEKDNNKNNNSSSSQALAAGVFKINTAVKSYVRLVNSLGTPKDTLELREKLHKMRLHIGQLVKDTSAKLKEASESDIFSEVSPLKKISDAKLAKDFQAVLGEFHKAQRLAAKKETVYAPSVRKEVLLSSYGAQEVKIYPSKSSEHQILVQESNRQEIVMLDNEIIFNQAIIEEREQGIIEIQQQISEVNEIFKDLAVLVHEQGVMIDDIGSNIVNSHASTQQATTQLAKASKYQKSSSSLVCLLMVMLGIIMLIVVVVVMA